MTYISGVSPPFNLEMRWKTKRKMDHLRLETKDNGGGCIEAKKEQKKPSKKTQTKGAVKAKKAGAKAKKAAAPAKKTPKPAAKPKKASAPVKKIAAEKETA